MRGGVGSAGLEFRAKLSAPVSRSGGGMNTSAMNDSSLPPAGSVTPDNTPPPDGTPPGQADPSRSWNIACHLAALSGLLTGIGFIVGPLIVWVLKKADYPSVDWHGKESLNFQISVLIYYAVLIVVSFFTCGLTWPLLVVLAVAQLVMVVIASIKVSNGERYQYPLTIRLIK
jgi:uncharacterized Tic20 family protein